VNSEGTFTAVSLDDNPNIWVANSGSGSLTKLRVSDGAIVSTIQVGGRPDAFVLDGADIWLATPGRGYVLKLDARDGKLLGSFGLGLKANSVG
jgi:hypothetical protein